MRILWRLCEGDDAPHWVTLPGGRHVLLGGEKENEDLIVLKNSDEYLRYGRGWEEQRREWTENERDSLRHYTGDAYMAMNDSLRAGGELSGVDRAAMRGMDKLFRSERGRIRHTVLVARGVSNHPLIELLDVGELKTGMEYEDKGYMSTTIMPAREAGFGSWKFLITVPKGARAVYIGSPPDEDGGEYSEAPEERELLLDRGTRIRVRGFSDKKREIYAEVVVD